MSVWGGKKRLSCWSMRTRSCRYRGNFSSHPLVRLHKWHNPSPSPMISSLHSRPVTKTRFMICTSKQNPLFIMSFSAWSNTNKKPKETNNLSREEFKNSIQNQLLCSQVQIIIVKKSSPVPIRSSLWSILQPTQNPYQLTEPKTFLKNSFLVHTALKITRIWKLTAAI